MAYEINKTDGSTVATVADGQIDTLSTDLTLIGKNYSGFGDELNENFVHLLENFADTKHPVNPLRGQLWFDTTEVTLKIYNGKEFIPVSSTAISDRQPASLRVGDLWFDNINKQLNFYDGTKLILISPIYSVSQQESGFKVESIEDTSSQTQTIIKFTCGGSLLGIFSSTEFTPRIPIAGFSGSIIPGFNKGDLTDLKFDVTCINSDKLGNVPASGYLKAEGAAVITGPVYVYDNRGIEIARGDATGDVSIKIDNTSNQNIAVFSNNIVGKDLHLRVMRNNGIPPNSNYTSETAMSISPDNRIVTFYDDLPVGEQCHIDINGSLTVTGDLEVIGTTTAINVVDLEVSDRNITLANGNPTGDIGADGGGITLVGDTAHSLTWQLDPNPAWNSSDNFNLAPDKYYAIADKPVIQQNDPNNVTAGFKLTDHVTYIGEYPVSDIFGMRTNLKIKPSADNGIVPWLTIEETNISTALHKDLILSPDGNITLENAPRIIGLADPVDDHDAATKHYVDFQPIFLSTTFNPGEYAAATDTWYHNLLNTLITGTGRPLKQNTVVSLLCTVIENNEVDASSGMLLSITSNAFCLYDNATGGIAGGAPAVTGVNLIDATVPPQQTTITRHIKTFICLGLNPPIWSQYNSDVLVDPVV